MACQFWLFFSEVGTGFLEKWIFTAVSGTYIGLNYDCAPPKKTNELYLFKEVILRPEIYNLWSPIRSEPWY